MFAIFRHNLIHNHFKYSCKYFSVTIIVQIRWKQTLLGTELYTIPNPTYSRNKKLFNVSNDSPPEKEP